MALTGRMFPIEREAIIIIKVEFLTLVAGVHVLTGVHTLNGDEILSALLVSVLVSEDHLGERSASAGIVNNVPHDSLHVAAQRKRG